MAQEGDWSWWATEQGDGCARRWRAGESQSPGRTVVWLERKDHARDVCSAFKVAKDVVGVGQVVKRLDARGNLLALGLVAL